MNEYASPEEKISLFRSLFRGREDVYPRRFESRKSGKSGYQPACGNEWVRGVCEKPRVKCSLCPNQKFLPVSDTAIRNHLKGQDEEGKEFVMGVYPMLLDESCFFLAVDFDKRHWKEDVTAVMNTCADLGVPAYLERSRSGQGGHVWIFFDDAIPAVLARRLGAHLLTETMERRPELGLDSYDRFFPNQDTLPRGGFGNLIALPLQKQPREMGNSVFIDESLGEPGDQWARLFSIRKTTRAEVENLTTQASAKGRIVAVDFPESDDLDLSPWRAPPSRNTKAQPLSGPLPSKVELILSDGIYVAKKDLSPGLRNRLIRLAAFQNPEFYKAQAMRLPTYGKPRIISCSEEYKEHLCLPRGCLEDLRILFTSLNIEPACRDERFAGEPLEIEFGGELRPNQKASVDALSGHDAGVLSATTAFGKTVVAAYMIALRGVNTLVLVHRQQLMEQWVARLATFLSIEDAEIGRIGGGFKKALGRVDVALIQSLVRKGVVNDRVADYGHLVVDECHHLPAASFEQIARRTKAKYLLGLSATVTRKDGHHPIVTMQCGPIRYRVDAKEQARLRPFSHTVVVRPTSFRADEVNESDQRMHFKGLCDAMIADPHRNRMICDDVVRAMEKDRSPLVLTERAEHLHALATLLKPQAQHLIVLKGGMGKKRLRDEMSKASSSLRDEKRVILATGKYIGEGFDDSRLDTLFLTMPVSWRGTIAQYAGRLHRIHDSKKDVQIYDYADLNEPMLARMFDRRCKGYEAIGYTIHLPASAVPGWPADVPLPMDSSWKRDYSASIKRLIRDGVDTPLADLFVHAARPFDPQATGADRARSATEKFLFKRLETLPAVAGRFRLNVVLPIPFDGAGTMEVDLLCKESGMAIELDGPQHLNSLDAYRRDRRKDAMLQENGYFVLRFLAEDVGQNLDSVLDTILRVHSGLERNS